MVRSQTANLIILIRQAPNLKISAMSNAEVSEAPKAYASERASTLIR
jgi:hypothetical protein